MTGGRGAGSGAGSGAGVEADRFDVRRARRASGLLAAFNQAGVLAASDVHVARRLAELAGEEDEAVWLAAALAVRGPRLGHVLVDLESIRQTAAVDADEPVDVSTLAWPAAGWGARVAASRLVVSGEEDVESTCPLRLVGSWLYLERYWREERQVAADLRSASQPADVAIDVLADGLGRLFAGEPADSRQRLAAATAVLRRLAVVAGGPGTGKTTTVAGIVALLCEQAAAADRPMPLVALAAPTGKAAARLEEAVHAEAGRLPVAPEIRAALAGLEASTVHRLLGWRPDSHSRFRHHRGQRLPHDVVIVDETSMVSLSLMARLVEAIRPQARLVLVGDPGQLASIEAGAVLGDIVGPAAGELMIGRQAAGRLAAATGRAISGTAEPPAGAVVADGIVVLDRVHRYRLGGGIARVADAIRRGDADAVLAALDGAGDGVTWIGVDVESPGAQDALAGVRERATSAGRAVAAAARAGDGAAALAALGAFRVLCAHRRGSQGVATWTARIEGWLAGEVAADGRWYVGRPLLVTENDYELRLYNGDTGVIVQTTADRVAAAFERRGEVLEFSPSRLGAVETVYAMTIHKSQGSQFDTAAVLLPAPDVAHPQPRAPLHGGDAGPAGAHPGRNRGGDPGGGGPAGGAGVGPAPAPVGRRRR